MTVPGLTNFKQIDIHGSKFIIEKTFRFTDPPLSRLIDNIVNLTTVSLNSRRFKD
jgi:hypothetical protein